MLQCAKDVLSGNTAGNFCLTDMQQKAHNGIFLTDNDWMGAPDTHIVQTGAVTSILYTCRLFSLDL